MSEYIKREDALGCVLGVFDRQRIKELPAADVAKVKHGKWEYIGTDKRGMYTDVPIVLEGLDWTMKPATAPTAEQRWIWRTKL